MAHITKKVAVFIVAVLLLAGCDFAFLAGGKTIGISSGQFFSTNGFFTKVYRHPFEQVYHACEKTLIDMNAVSLEKTVKIATGSMQATLHGDKIIIEITYVSAEQTSVAVLIGMTGNYTASKLIYDKIASNLQKQ